MVISEQMHHAMDEQEGDEVFVTSLEFFRLYFGNFLTDKNLAGIFGEGKTQNVSRLINVAILFVQLLDLLFLDKNETQIVLYTEDFIFIENKRHGWKRAFCFVCY